MTLTNITNFSILSSDYAHDPYQFLPALRDETPVHYEPGIDSYFLSHYEHIRPILENHTDFTTETLQVRAEPVMRGPVLAQMTGTEHTAKRKIVIRGFTGRALEDQEHAIRDNAIKLIAPFLATGHVDLVNDFGKTFAVYTTLDILGLDESDWQQVAAWHKGVAEFITAITLTDDQRRYCISCAEELEAYLLPIIAERRDEPGTDLISQLCTARFNDIGLSDRDVTALIINVLAAAIEPAAKTLALLFKHLLDNPHQLDEVRQDLGLLPAAIAETLRYTPPVQLIPRRARVTTKIAGTSIPAGATVFCMIGGANRDPAVFTRPDDFDIHRPDLGVARSFTAAAQHLAFGTGLHQRVGAAFAKTEIETVVAVLLPLLQNAQQTNTGSYREVGLYTRGPVALPLDFTPMPPPMKPGL